MTVTKDRINVNHASAAVILPLVKPDEKGNWIERVKRYCAKDTLAMVNLMRHL